jgi:hypothetical protein
LTICPCCGSKSLSDLGRAWSDGCISCGARSVGEPLPRPDHELPSYGRSLVLAVMGTLMVLLLLTQTVSSFGQYLPSFKTYNETFYAAGAAAFDFEMWFAAAQTAAWRLKWLAIPMTIIVFWGGRKLYRSIVKSPTRFCGVRYARRGYFAAASVPFLILILIGITIPERLQQREDAFEAGSKALGYASDRLLLQYRKEFGTFPSEMKELGRLQDPDGSIKNFLKEIEAAGYKASAEVASVPKSNRPPLRGAVIRNASLDTEEVLNEGLSFTNYELRLPGYDKLLGTDDDMIVRDGLVSKVTEIPRRPGSTTAATEITKP